MKTFFKITFLGFVFILTDILVSLPAYMQVTDPRPEIFAVYFNPGNEIDPFSISMYVDGLDVTRWANITPTRISYTPLKPLEEGSHLVRVIVHPPSSNLTVEKEWSFEFSFSTSDAEIILDPVMSPTNKTNIQLSGSTIPEREVEMLVNGIHEAYVYSQYSGRFYTGNIKLEEGYNYITAIVRDPITDEVSREFRANRIVRLDSIPPEVLGTIPGDGESINGPVNEIVINYTDGNGTGVNLGSLALFMDGKQVYPQIVTESSCTYEPGTELLPGLHKFQLSLYDNVGNRSDIYNWEFNLVGPPGNEPAIHVTERESSGEHAVVSGSEDPSPTVTTAGPGDIPTPTPTPYDFTYEPPHILYPQEGSLFRDPKITVSGVASPNLTVQLAVNNVILLETSSDSKGNYVFMDVVLKSGENELKCRVTDRKGGYSDYSVPVHVFFEPLLTRKIYILMPDFHLKPSLQETGPNKNKKH